LGLDGKKHGMTEQEGQGWFANELDFAKRIVTPLNEPSTKRRRDVTLGNNIYKNVLLTVTN
jgi:hypothetical protein